MFGVVPVAQMDRATASDAVGRGFESLPERHNSWQIFLDKTMVITFFIIHSLA